MRTKKLPTSISFMQWKYTVKRQSKQPCTYLPMMSAAFCCPYPFPKQVYTTNTTHRQIVWEIEVLQILNPYILLDSLCFTLHGKNTVDIRYLNYFAWRLRDSLGSVSGLVLDLHRWVWGWGTSQYRGIVTFYPAGNGQCMINPHSHPNNLARQYYLCAMYE
jgi:hypothetical protein